MELAGLVLVIKPIFFKFVTFTIADKQFQYNFSYNYLIHLLQT